MSDRQVRALQEEDLSELYAIREVAFLDPTDYTKPENREFPLARLKYRTGSFEDGHLAASASWYPFNMFLNGAPQEVWGLASVCTAGEFRRRGHVKDLLTAGIEMMYNQGASWCLEYPFDTRFYRRWGWETISNGSFLEIPSARLPKGKVSAQRMRLDDPEAMDRAAQIYASYAAGYNFMFARDHKIQESWNHLFGDSPWPDPARRFAWLLEDAYCVTIIKQQDHQEKLIVLDYAYSTPSGFQALLKLWGALEGQVSQVRLQLPSDAPLLVEWSNFLVPHPHPLHARIIDVERAFEGIPIRGQLSLVLDVVDEHASWNQGCFEVFGDQTLSAKRSDKRPDLRLHISALARLLSGTSSLDALIRYAEVELLNSNGLALNQMNILPSHMSLSDYF